MAAAAVRLAGAADYRGLGTFEFLVTGEPTAQRFHFMEANARLQVEHTVTEEVTGVDLVQLQLRLAQGATLASLGFASPPAAHGHAVQARVNMETMTADGETMPSGGVLTAFDPPTGPGLRTDTFGYAGYATSSHFDSLLAKVVARSDVSFAARGAQGGACAGGLPHRGRGNQHPVPARHHATGAGVAGGSHAPCGRAHGGAGGRRRGDRDRATLLRLGTRAGAQCGPSRREAPHGRPARGARTRQVRVRGHTGKPKRATRRMAMSPWLRRCRARW